MAINRTIYYGFLIAINFISHYFIKPLNFSVHYCFSHDSISIVIDYFNGH